MTKIQTDEEIRKLVIERIKAMSDEAGLVVGGDKKMTKAEMIENVEKGSNEGKQIVDMQMTFLRDMASGKLMEVIRSH